MDCFRNSLEHFHCHQNTRHWHRSPCSRMLNTLRVVLLTSNAYSNNIKNALNTFKSALIVCMGVCFFLFFGIEKSWATSLPTMPLLFNEDMPSAQRHISPDGKIPTVSYRIRPVPQGFFALEGWSQNDFYASFQAFLKSCPLILGRQEKTYAFFYARFPHFGTLKQWQGLCHSATQLADAYPHSMSFDQRRAYIAREAKRFFRHYFTPVMIGSPYTTMATIQGQVTAYFLPKIEGRPEPSVLFSYPLVQEERQGALKHLSQIQIIRAARRGRLKNLAWIKPSDALSLSSNRSVLLFMKKGEEAWRKIKLFPVGTNAFQKIRVLDLFLTRGEFLPTDMSVSGLHDWFKKNPERLSDAFTLSPHYIFFSDDPHSGKGLLSSLTPGYSLAVDTNFYALGMPIWVGMRSNKKTKLDAEQEHQFFGKLMIAQDESLIARGPQQGDIFLGFGQKFESSARFVHQAGELMALVPALSVS